jgi:hypothetical protein
MQTLSELVSFGKDLGLRIRATNLLPGALFGLIVLMILLSGSSFAVHSPAAAHAAWTSMISVEVGWRG